MEFMNTLMYTKRLEQMGVSRENAEAFVTVNSEMIMNEVATKADLKLLETQIEIKLTKIENRFTEIDSKLSQTKNQLLIQLGSLIVVCSTAIASLMTILK